MKTKLTCYSVEVLWAIGTDPNDHGSNTVSIDQRTGKNILPCFPILNFELSFSGNFQFWFQDGSDNKVTWGHFDGRYTIGRIESHDGSFTNNGNKIGANEHWVLLSCKNVRGNFNFWSHEFYFFQMNTNFFATKFQVLEKTWLPIIHELYFGGKYLVNDREYSDAIFFIWCCFLFSSSNNKSLFQHKYIIVEPSNWRGYVKRSRCSRQVFRKWPFIIF